MCNIVPYLKTHTVRNMPSFNACSKLLASLSSYQYTRKAWKKDVFDLLLDNSLFQMDHACLKFWRVIVDNLMTHDNTTFRDLMSKYDKFQMQSSSYSLGTLRGVQEILSHCLHIFRCPCCYRSPVKVGHRRLYGCALIFLIRLRLISIFHL